VYDHRVKPDGEGARARAATPLLAVIGGPTGAGKSTLVNSLVRAPVSATGFLRPTTRKPVMVCHPRSFAAVHRHNLMPIIAPALPPNLAIIDAPDINSIDQANRALSDELFDDADLWLFVTTAARYADAEAWRHLRAAQQRRVGLAIVLDRVPVHAVDEILPHLTKLLGEPVPLFVVPESPLDRQGMLPERVVTPVWEFLHKSASAKIDSETTARRDQ
jgi:energy-coupling factor transporter ATP-binding protein EcfA2